MKKIISFVLIAVIAISFGLTGCAKTDFSKDMTTIYIRAYEAGYGADWLQVIGNAFEEETGIKVKVDKSNLLSSLTTAIDSQTTTYDLYMITQHRWSWMQNDELLADISDVWNGNVYGEEILMKDKMQAEYEDWFAVNDKYYNLPVVAGTKGFLYSKKAWKSEWPLPRTTDEMFSVLDASVQEGYKPFIYSSKDSYWKYASFIWAAQYDGSEAYNQYLNGYSKEGEKNVPEIIIYPGKLEELNIVSKIFDKKNKYIDEFSFSSDFTTAQGYFLASGSGRNSDRKNLIMMNGDWIEQEMRRNYTKDELDIGYMRLPIVSALAPKLGITEETLKELVDYADKVLDNLEVTNEPEFEISVGKDLFDANKTYTKKEVIEAVIDARSMFAPTSDLSLYLPAKNNKKDMAKKFLSYLGTDKAISLLFNNSYGNLSPYKYDYENDIGYSEATTLTKDKIKIISNPTNKATPSAEKHPLFFSGLDSTHKNGFETYENIFYSDKAPSPYSVYIGNYTNVLNRWSSIMISAGLI